MSEITASAKAEESEKSGSKTKRGARKDINDPSFNMEEIRDLADLVDEYGLTDFEFENENIRVRLSKMTAAPVMHTVPPALHAAAASTAPPAATKAETETTPTTSADEDLFKITSPIVGTFYRSPGPDKEPYVKEGSTVSPDSVVCIVEAMKLMNEIQAETSGEVVKIYVENGQPVEYGQPLFGIRK
jgi:acetyl-CoA carboxylase biotin carboxyl carrier protein